MADYTNTTLVDFSKIHNRIARMLYLFHKLYDQEFILLEEAQLMKRTLFRDEQKILPALKSYEKSHNLIDFRDRMRGYLGLPRRRSSVMKSSQASSFRKGSHQVQTQLAPLKLDDNFQIINSGQDCLKKQDSSSSNIENGTSSVYTQEAKDTISMCGSRGVLGSSNQLSPINQEINSATYIPSQGNEGTGLQQKFSNSNIPSTLNQKHHQLNNNTTRKLTDQYLTVPQKQSLLQEVNSSTTRDKSLFSPNTIKEDYVSANNYQVPIERDQNYQTKQSKKQLK